MIPDSKTGAMTQSIVTSVVVPALREADNLRLLIPALSEVLRLAELSHEIIIVDDNSNDGTDQLIEELAVRFPVRLHVRTDERGLSSAVVYGFKRATGDILVCMDADLSHPVSAVPELVSAIKSNEADFAIGSRYVPGGSIDSEWSRMRRLNSRVAGLLARPLTSVRDPGSGFFALRRVDFERVASKVNTLGFKIGLELLVKVNPKRCKEVAIHFQDRKAGSSKMKFRQQSEYLIQLMQLAWHRVRA